MKIHFGFENLILKRPVVTLGIFDGVHKGHRALLHSVISAAEQRGGESVVVTFNPHPRLVLSENHEGLSFLTTLDEKKRILEETLIGHLIIIEFNEYLINMSACEFISKVLVEKIGINHLIVGYDHHFGKGGEGDFNTISDCAGRLGFSVEKVEEVSENNVAISSTSIREALLKGQLAEANNYLGYSYSLTGIVVHGKMIGRNLGFPTANIRTADIFKLIPADGVYAVEIELNGRLHKGMLSIGTNPTVNKGMAPRSVEVNIFDLDRDLYGQELRIIFRYRLRDEIQFGSEGELASQIEIDRQNALELLGEQ